MKCSICADKARKKIDAALVKEGATIRGIANTFRVSEDSLTRHVKNGHVLARIAKAQKAQDVVEADDLLKEVQETEKITRYIISNSIKKTITIQKDGEDVVVPNPDYDTRIALHGLARREKQIELKGRVLGSFRDGKKDPGSSNNNPPTVVVYVPDNGRKSG